MSLPKYRPGRSPDAYNRKRQFDPWERSHANGRMGWKSGNSLKTRRHR